MQLFLGKVREAEDSLGKYVAEHLARLHEPGGYVLEKQENDFMELGMRRHYVDALDDMQFSIDQQVVEAQIFGRKRGTAQVITRWSVRGQHNRPLLGMPASGQSVTISGVTYTTFRNYYLKLEYSYWELPELTRRMVER